MRVYNLPKVCQAVLIALLCLCILFPAAAGAVKWYSFSEDHIPDELGFLVNEFTGTLTLTFLGDCTLGGEEISLNNPKGFFKTIEREGKEYPFSGLVKLTANDDLTIANLEGVLSDSNPARIEKVFNFKGPTEYTDILKAGSIECVSLANNHSGDYGRQGYRDTCSALENADVAWFGTDRVAVCEVNGVLIGFAGISITLNGNAGARYRKHIQALKDAGCAAVITVMHAGTEYDPTPNVYQKRMAKKAVTYGSDLIIGHHPHVVQGYESINGVPVVYSLGNCSFGGNTYPTDRDAMVVQAELEFNENELKRIRLHFYPILISSDSGVNDFKPVLQQGIESERILTRLVKSTGNGFDSYSDVTGAVVTFDVNKK